MKRYIWAVVALLAVCVPFVITRDMAAAQAPARQPAGQQWEYAVMYDSRRLKMAVFQTPDAPTVRGETVEKLLASIGVKMTAPDDRGAMIDFMNHVGSQGWELTSFRDTGENDHQIWFRRKSN